jgi:hypothetical protein
VVIEDGKPMIGLTRASLETRRLPIEEIPEVDRPVD